MGNKGVYGQRNNPVPITENKSGSDCSGSDGGGFID